MSRSSDESTILIVDSLPLRNLGLVTLLDRLSGTTKFRLASLTPDDAERWIGGDAHCSMIIYNVGGASVGDHKHLKRIKGLRARAGEAPLVILSDNDSREEILSALGAGAQGFLYAGTNAQLALQALSFIFKGGSYFPAAAQPRRRSSVPLNGTMELRPSAVACTTLDIGDAIVESVADTGSTNINLTERQKSVLERLGHGDSNKAIARVLGIREGTVKVHVRQIMRKLGVTNRTQVAIACASGTGNGAVAVPEMRVDDRSLKAKLELAPSPAPLGVSLAGGKI
ncbi:MAG TPA: response regulator transcription factor [Reyranella sp.]|nr:response regulator transcription factor [Reyranella sp.]